MKFYEKCRHCGVSSSICFLAYNGFCSMPCQEAFKEKNRKPDSRKKKAYLIKDNAYYSARVSGDQIITNEGVYWIKNCRYGVIGDYILFVPSPVTELTAEYLHKLKEALEKSGNNT